MDRLNITAKIWLSIGVFVLGFIIATVLEQIQGVRTEAALRTTSEALFPAAQGAQDAEAAFQRAVKAFSDAVVVQDASGLDRASEEGRKVVDGLNNVAGISGLAPARSEQARQLASSIDGFFSDAVSTYRNMLANAANLTADTQQRVRDLASRTDSLKGSLASVKERFSEDLRAELAAVRSRSAA